MNKPRRRTILRKGINKRCTKCKEVKILSEFHKDKSRKDGCRYKCKLCVQKQARVYYQDNKARAKEYYQTHKIELQTKQRQYRISNKTSIASQKRQYRDCNRTHITMHRKQARAAVCVNDLTHKLPGSDHGRFEDNKLTVICKHCNIRFQPTVGSVYDRIASVKHIGRGDSNFYCSDACKTACVLYGFKTNSIDPRSLQSIPKSEQDVARSCQTDHLKQLQCDEAGHNYCEKCGDIIDVELHHTQEISRAGMKAVTSSGHILLCPGCHVELHGECL